MTGIAGHCEHTNIGRIILVRVYGQAASQFLFRAAEEMTSAKTEVLDIGQATLHGVMVLSFLLNAPVGEADKLTARLTELAQAENLSLSAIEWSEDAYRQWSHNTPKYRHIVTLISRSGDAGVLHEAVKAILREGFIIETAYRRSARVPLEPTVAPKYRCLEFLINSRQQSLESIEGLRSGLFAISGHLDVDIAVQEDNAFYRCRRLIAFDMDSTLIQMEVIDELAGLAGRRSEVESITAASMRGEIDFRQSIKARVALLKGLPETAVSEVADNLPLTKGAERLISTLKDFGYKVAIITGGFAVFAERLRDIFSLDYVYSNTLESKDGQLTGRLIGRIIDAEAKADILAEICDREGLDLNQAIAVGDGANDLPMLNLAGLGIAFHAKPYVRERSKQTISKMGLDSILYLLGFNDRDLKV